MAESLIAKLPSTCVPYCVADTRPQTPALDHDCVFVAEWDEQGSTRRCFVPMCGGTTPEDEICVQAWAAEQMSPACANVGFNLELSLRRPPGGEREPGFSVSAVCRPSEDRAVDCPEL